MSLRRLQLATSWGPLALLGGSRAGEGTLLLLPMLRLALDPGRPHRALPPMSTLFLSHGHLDHIGALGYWLSQRFLGALGPATAVVPEAIADEVEQLVALFARLEGGRPYPVRVVRAGEGTVHRLRPDIDLVPFRTEHWVDTLGVELTFRKRRLRADLVGLPPEEIVRRRREGEEVGQEERVSLLAYCADTGPELLERRPDLLATEVLLLECSFFRPADRDRARRYGHVHLEDLVALADRLRCRHLVLLHGSRRERLRDIESALKKELAPRVACPVHHLMVDWE